MKTIRDIKYFQGVKVLVRTDFNVPIQDGKVVDDFRIRMVLPTVDFLCKKGAKVILVSHLETNMGENTSLKPVFDSLKKLDVNVDFVDNIKNAHDIIEHKMQNGSVVLLENVRYFEGEKKNDAKFAQELASLGDIFVNEAFPVSHREHASVVGIPKYLPSYAGLQFEKEVTNLSRAFDPKRPFIFILGGAKFETKLPLLEKFLDKADKVFIGGALANDFFKVKGFEIGCSRVSEATPSLSKYIDNEKLLLPVDCVDTKNRIWPANAFPKDEKIVDVGPKTVELLRKKIRESRFILWNGPLGLYEGGYKIATNELAKIIASMHSNMGAKDQSVVEDMKVNTNDDSTVSIIGGGDTLAAIEELGISNKYSFVSTGGGAMLDFLANGTLPGIEAMNESVA